MRITGFVLVISRVKSNQKLLYSTLYSTRTFIQKSLNNLIKMADKEKQDKIPSTDPMNDDTDEEIDSSVLSSRSATPTSFTSASLQLVQTPLKYIHDEYCNGCGTMPGAGWSDLQRVCICILMDLIGAVMMYRRKDGDRDDVIRLVMEGVTHCHCGGLQLLEWEEVKRRRSALTDDDDDDTVLLTPEKVAILSCCLLKEDCSYLPSVLSHEYRLLLGLTHINCILDYYAISNSTLTLISLVWIE